MRILLCLGALLLCLVSAAPAAAQPAPHCPAGQPPTFVLGFAALKERLGDRMGEPIECEHVNPENRDALQLTSTGLAYYRRAINTAIFTDGIRHWALTARGVVTWSDQSVEPPPHAVAMGENRGAVLPHHRVVAYYGNPLASVLGVLGEPPPEQMLARLQEQADAYAALDPDRPVLPALELIATVAQASPGADGLYRARMDPALIEQVAGWAEAHGYLLILDIQIGRSTVEAEVAPLLPYLERPYVHLALDPEFAMAPGQARSEFIGSLDASEINVASRMLREVVDAHGLPPKMLIVHRFRESMVTNAESIDLDPRVQVVIDMDGFGSPTAKISVYNDLVRDQGVEYAGIKLFYQYDAPLLSPQDVLNLQPSVDVVIYQ